ncbi:MAG: Uma2 family endonuclease [candidate division KSB1 bacterium]|nr:Uma2 family endonuclease [candidate division KSB1 bacterium]MDZ7368674.1 Uma2 family endonuclease [candidate division KSB1 bacterium]MDZ7406489.1 Uma2 family endonuclease [candidate division KSB1 bacterium]
MATTIVPTLPPRQNVHREKSLAAGGVLQREEEYLPESDGKPMAETDRHRDQMVDLLHALQEHFRENPQVYVSGNIFVYYLDENGDRQSVSPDILVVFGVEKKERRIYKIDEEGKGPEVVIELTSPSTKVEDLVTKHYIYANLGVREYFLFDPYGETAQPPLRGFRLKGGEYVPIAGNVLTSEVLGLVLKVEENELRLYHPETSERLRTPAEAEAARREAEAARQQAEAARQQAEAARQQAEAARQQAEAARQQAEAARREAEVARRQAEALAEKESAARQAAETELARLQKELAKLQAKS